MKKNMTARDYHPHKRLESEVVESVYEILKEEKKRPVHAARRSDRTLLDRAHKWMKQHPNRKTITRKELRELFEKRPPAHTEKDEERTFTEVQAVDMPYNSDIGRYGSGWMGASSPNIFTRQLVDASTIFTQDIIDEWNAGTVQGLNFTRGERAQNFVDDVVALYNSRGYDTIIIEYSGRKLLTVYRNEWENVIELLQYNKRTYLARADAPAPNNEAITSKHGDAYYKAQEAARDAVLARMAEEIDISIADLPNFNFL